MFSPEALSVAQETNLQDWFKAQSLELLKDQLALGVYPGYPDYRLTVGRGAHKLGEFSRWYLPAGKWQTTSPQMAPYSDEVHELQVQGFALDALDRPLHPWFEDMISDPGLGVVTGKGAYWNWGPNYTADPIIVRHDLGEPHVLLITREDTGYQALPGGFVDAGETALQAAAREAMEEALIDISGCTPEAQEVYSGPLADLRVTANAWPETTAFRFDIPDEQAALLPIGPYQGGDDATKAEWVPRTAINDRLYGSHNLLIELAFR